MLVGNESLTARNINEMTRLSSQSIQLSSPAITSLILHLQLSQLTYLVAFSCELSRILDTRRTSTDSISIFLCTIYFVLFLSATILINGLATRMAVGLLLWALIVSILTIPELWLIMVQFWVSRKTKTACRGDFKFVFRAWSQIMASPKSLVTSSD